jgi:urease accessory protein UreF
MKPVQIKAQRPQVSDSEMMPFSGAPLDLMDRIGPTAPLFSFTGPDAVLLPGPITNATGLKTFLCAYATQVLNPVELPLIARACACALRNQARELIELDHTVGTLPGMDVFSEASRIIGRERLQHLRPLKDHRVAQRYLAALDEGRVVGWHPVVYGVFLAIYSVPPRQGLLRYGESLLTELAASACRSAGLPQQQGVKAAASAIASLPKGIENAVALI